MNTIKSSDDKLHPKVPTEYPDAQAAQSKPHKGGDRPGFDLGGSSEAGRRGPVNTLPGGPQTTTPVGGTAGGSAHAMGGSEGSGAPDGTGGPNRQGR